MAQTDNPFLDGMAKMFTDAAGMAQGLGPRSTPS